MPKFTRSSLLFVVLGGVVCTLGAWAPVCAQDVTAAQPDHSAVALSASSTPFLHLPSHAEAFAAFMQEVGFDDLAARKEAITGEAQPRVDWKTMNQKSIGLTGDQWATARFILLEGSQRVADWGDEMHEALGWKDGRFQSDPSQGSAERLAVLDSLSREGDPIIDDTMARLERQLGAEDFSKLDCFVFQREGGERILDQGPIRRGPIETAKASVQVEVPAQK